MHTKNQPKNQKPLNIFRVSTYTVTECIEIADQLLGKNYLTESDFLARGTYAVCGKIGRTVIGFSIGIRPMHAGKICRVSSVAVRPQYQGLGFGYLLVRSVVKYLDKRPHEEMLMAGWNAPDGVHIARIAHALHFVERATIPDYWRDDSLNKGYQCPACGNPPCRCSAVLYARQSPCHQ